MNINLIGGFHSTQWGSDSIAVFELTSCSVKLTMLEEGSSISIQLDKTYPILGCCSRTLTAKLVEVALNPNIEFLSRAKPVALKRQEKYFSVTILKKTQHVEIKKCTVYGNYFPGCPVAIKSEFTMRLVSEKQSMSRFRRPYRTRQPWINAKNDHARLYV